MRVLISVYDKTGLEDLARELVVLGHELVASGGTATALQKADIPHITVESVTEAPEMLGGRVKTLHPLIHGGILADLDNEDHQKDIEDRGLVPVGMVVCNLYPFSSNPSIELIDVGGPTMVRAAAKNWAHVGSVVDPGDYDEIIAELRENGVLSDETRKALAAKAFAHTAAYDLAIVDWISDGEYVGVLGQKVQDCDYGENRWQSPAALYRFVDDTDPLSVASSYDLIAGREPSYVNWTDVDRLSQTQTHLIVQHETNCGHHPYVAVAVKHGNPCGAGVADTPEEAVKLMLTGDKKAVFGSIIMVNFHISEAIADLLLRYESDVRRLIDGICAPSFDEAAIPKLGRKDGKYFLATNPALAEPSANSLDTRPLMRQVRGGFLREPNYTNVINLEEATGNEALTPNQRCDMSSGIAICGTSNSNTMTAVRDNQLIGNGVGQQDRVSCAELAVWRARENGHSIDELALAGATVVSDSFCPFKDTAEVLIAAGMTAFFAATGSRNDGDTQEVCQEAGVTLVQQEDASARMFYRH